MLSFISLVKFLKICTLILRYLIIIYDLHPSDTFSCLTILLGNRCTCVLALHMLSSVILTRYVLLL